MKVPMLASRRAASGRIALDVKARALAPGDALRGRITLQLVAPTPALRLSVRLEARRRAVSGGGAAPLRYRQELVWHAERELDGERSFEDGSSWPFELLVPDDALSPNFGQRGASRFAVSWRVIARLERPWTFSLTAEAPVQVKARAPRRPRKPRRPSDGAR
jgi:hypothetical protein